MTIYSKIFSALWDITMFIGFYAALGALTIYVLFAYDKYVEQKRKRLAEAAEKQWAEKQAQIKKNEERVRAMAAYRQELLEQAEAAEKAESERYEAEEARQEAEEAEWCAAQERAEAERKQRRVERRTKIRSEMDPDLVSLLDELNLFDRMTHYDETLGEAFYRIGIKTLTILAGRNAGGGGGIQPQKLEKEYRVPVGVAVDLKQKAIARLQRPARSPARVRPTTE